MYYLFSLVVVGRCGAATISPNTKLLLRPFKFKQFNFQLIGYRHIDATLW
jgi:hypothetical protein